MTWTPNEVVHLKATVIEQKPEGVHFHIDGAIGEVIIRHPHLVSEHTPVVAKIGLPIAVGDPVRGTGFSGHVLAIVGAKAWVGFPDGGSTVVRVADLERTA